MNKSFLLFLVVALCVALALSADPSKLTPLTKIARACDDDQTECPAGCCPDDLGTDAYCCPDNLYCAQTAEECPCFPELDNC